MRRRTIKFILTVQGILFLAHAFVYETWTAFTMLTDPPGIPALAIVFAILSISFVIASLLAFRYYVVAVRVLYTLAAGWLGILNFFFLASFVCWIVYAAERLADLSWQRRDIALVLFGAATAVAFLGIANASWTRVKRIHVRLPNLPESWRGRMAAFV